MINPNASYLAPPGPRDLDRKAVEDLTATHAGLKTLADLVSLVSNASKSKDVIAQHVRAAEDARAALAAYDAERTEMDKARLAHHEQITRERTEHESGLAKKQSEFDAEHQRKSVALTARIAAADAREQKLKAAEELTAALRADLDRRIGLLKSAAA